MKQNRTKQKAKQQQQQSQTILALNIFAVCDMNSTFASVSN